MEDKRLKYFKFTYMTIFTLIMIYIVRNKFVIPMKIFKSSFYLEPFQKLSIGILGILAFTISVISYCILGAKFNRKDIKKYWTFESFRKFVWVKGIDSVFLDEDDEGKKMLMNISNFIAASLVSIVIILIKKPEWSLLLLHLIIILIIISLMYFKKKYIFNSLESIQIKSIDLKDKFKLLGINIVANIANMFFLVYVIRQFTNIEVVNLCIMFCLAQVLGQLSLFRDGLIIFDLVILDIISKLASPQLAIFVIISYRLAYNVLPWIISLIMIFRELYNKSSSEESTKQFVFQILSIFTFIVGLILCLSVATPSVLYRIKFLRHFIKKDVVILARFITLTSGGLLILLSSGIKKSVKKVFYITEIILIISIFSTILKGLDVEESVLTLLLSIVLYIMKDDFTENEMRFSVKAFADTSIKIFLTTVVFVLISNISRKVNFFSSHKRFSLNYLVENKWMILLYMIFLLILSFAFQYTRTEKMKFKKLTDEEFDKISEFLEKYDGNEFSHLVYLNDKNVFFDKTNTVMIMYRPMNNTVIVLGDPIGEKENFIEAVNEFIIYCNKYHMNVCFYEINGENLELYCDQGFRFIKVGQDATVNLNEFSLVGKKNRTWRHVLNNFDKGNFDFRVEEMTDDLLFKMKKVSDLWLQGKSEMGFSLGFFDEDYLKRTKVACIYHENELLAFANLQPFYDDKTISIDLMRYDKSKEVGLMDFLFIKLILWAQENNYEKFYLGMAPLSKVGDKIYSKKKERFFKVIYNFQNKVYNFKGLRSYKDKFKPDWSNKYIAYTSDFNLPYILISVINSKKK